LKLRFLGGTQEVGRSAIAVSSGNTTILLDYGVMLNREPELPLHIPPKEVNGILLTHAHLDHSGGIPLFHIRQRIPVYTTTLTLELTRILIKDLLKLSGYYLPYEYADLESMLQNAAPAECNETFRIGDFKVKFIEAGHIPGSVQIILEAENKKILYTGDVNAYETKLLKAADTGYGELSAIIIESTYADENHPERLKLEEEFVGKVREVVERGGTALIPAFSVGRSQEVICILESHGFEYPVFMDGLALEANEVMLKHPKYFKDYMLLKKALEKTRWINGWRERRQTVKKPCAIVSPAGMLKGGAAAYYVEKVAKNPRNAIFLVSFQIPGTPGRFLLEEKRIYVSGKPKPVEAELGYFHFSSHADGAGLRKIVKAVKGDPKVFVVHGNRDNCLKFSEWIRSELGFWAESPKQGETYKI
jgi:putative mRNA 3-end processing factor